MEYKFHEEKNFLLLPLMKQSSKVKSHKFWRRWWNEEKVTSLSRTWDRKVTISYCTRKKEKQYSQENDKNTNTKEKFSKRKISWNIFFEQIKFSIFFIFLVRWLNNNTSNYSYQIINLNHCHFFIFINQISGKIMNLNISLSVFRDSWLAFTSPTLCLICYISVINS